MLCCTLFDGDLEEEQSAQSGKACAAEQHTTLESQGGAGRGIIGILCTHRPGPQHCPLEFQEGTGRAFLALARARTGQDLERVLGLVQTLEAAQAARGAEAQREREVRERLAAARAPAHAPLQPAHARLVRVRPLPARARG